MIKKTIPVIAILFATAVAVGCAKKEETHKETAKQSDSQPTVQEAMGIDSETIAFQKADAKAKEYLIQLYPQLINRLEQNSNLTVTLNQSLDSDTDGLTRYKGKLVTGFVLEANWSGNTIIYQNEQTYNDLSASIGSIKSITEYKEGKPNGWKLTPEREYLEIESTFPKGNRAPMQYEEFSFFAEYVFEKGTKPDWLKINPSRKLSKLGFASIDHHIKNLTLDKSINTSIEQGRRSVDLYSDTSVNYLIYSERDPAGVERRVEINEGGHYIEDGSSPHGKFKILFTAGQRYQITLDIYDLLSTAAPLHPYSKEYSEIEITDIPLESWTIKYNIAIEEGSGLPIPVTTQFTTTGNKITDLKVEKPDGLTELDYQKMVTASEQFSLKITEIAKEIFSSRKDMIDDIFLRNKLPLTISLPVDNVSNLIK